MEAEALQSEALALAKEVLGMGHPDTYKYMRNLALVYHAQRHWVEAEGLYTQVLDGFKKTLGLRHSDTLEAIQDLDVIQREMKEHATPKSNEEMTLADRSKEAPSLENGSMVPGMPFSSRTGSPTSECGTVLGGKRT